MTMKKFTRKISTCVICELLLVFQASSLLGNLIGKSNLTPGVPVASGQYPRLQHRIAGGKVTSLENVPFNVQFFNMGGMCGGTILSKKIVVTAAHCFDFNVVLKEMKVLASSRFLFDHRSKSHNVWHFKIHEKYNQTMNFENDIAIIMIVDEFIYRTTVRYAQLCNTDIWKKENESFLVTGWGEQKYGAGVLKQTLMSTNMQYVSNIKCNWLNEIRLTEDMFCLYGDGKRDTCRGDSGGGVFWHNIGYSDEVPKNKKVVVVTKTSDNMRGKIVGGIPVSVDQFPYMVQIYNVGNMCAGNILNSWTILTSAHCFDLNKNVEEVVVQSGSRFVYDFNADTYGVTSIVIHHKYNESQNFACDLALVFLDRAMQFTEKTKKVLLVNDSKWMNRRELNFTVTGWGLTKYGGKLSEKGLMMTNLRYIPNDECGRMHDMTFTRDMFCLYGEGTRDTCKGDSGGGVLWHGMLVGLTSHGDGCAKKHKPSIYSNVSYFRQWIKNQINKFIEHFCETTKRILK